MAEQCSRGVDGLVKSRPARIAVVTVNWNGWQNSLACLEALRAGTGPDWHFFLVDNASQDDSLAHLSDLGKDVTLIKSPINGGWTGGNNIGVKRALDNGHQFIFLLNNDAFVEPDTLSVLMTHFSKDAERMPVLGPVHKDPGRQQYNFLGAAADAATGLWMRPTEGSQTSDLNESFETSWIKGAGIFIHRRHFEKLGLFDDRFFLNFDEIDWCYRARKAGYPLLMVRDAIINHVGYVSMGETTSPMQTYFMKRNGLLFAEKHLSNAQRVALLRKYWWDARDIPRNVPRRLWLLHFLVARSSPTRAFRRGMLDYLFRRFGDCPAVVRQWQRDEVGNGPRANHSLTSGPSLG
jgi:GT2 family glycosyltransferase